MNQPHAQFGMSNPMASSFKDKIRLIYALIAIVALILFCISLLLPSKLTSLRIVLESPEAGVLQVYYDLGDGLHEEISVRSSYSSGVNKLTLSMPEGTIKAMRLDPAPGTREIRLRSISIESPRLGQKVMVPVEALAPVNQTKKISADTSGALFEILDLANDPQLHVVLQNPVIVTKDTGVSIRGKNLLLCSVLLSVFLILSITRPVSVMATWLLIPLVLIAAMATITTTARSIHPDEYSHISAARYYLSHWKPPAANDARMEESYTPYGTSYLNELDVVYFFAAKVSSAWAHLSLDEAVALRWFNVLLFAILIVFSWNSRPLWPGAALLIATPQVWYIFSYFNGDAFSLFLSFMMVFLCAARTSSVAQFIDAGQSEGPSRWVAAVLFSIVLGLLLVSKRNYLAVIFILGLFLSIRHLRLPLWSATVATAGAALFIFRYAANLNADGIPQPVVAVIVPLAFLLFLIAGVGLLRQVWSDSALRPKFLRLVSLFLLGCAIAFPRYMIDRHVNGDAANKQQVLHAMAEKHAIPGLKPSAIANGAGLSLPGNNLAEKGVGYFELFDDSRGWIDTSWKSMLGMYGYMEFMSNPLLYLLISFGLAVCLLRLVWQAKRNPEFRPYFAVGLLGIALTVFSSTIFSWVVDFQPQGRYLLPSVPILAATLIADESLARSRVIHIALAACFFGSICSFIFYGMPPLIAR